ncbi:hypothetical protein IL306_010787, partial [Fusarium sp. DS 682]
WAITLLDSFIEKVLVHCAIFSESEVDGLVGLWYQSLISHIPFDPAETALVLQILACSLQNFPPPPIVQVDGIINQRPLTAELCHEASKGAIEGVDRLTIATLKRAVLAAFYEKCRGNMKEFRTLIRTAQQMAVNLGMHKRSGIEGKMGCRILCCLSTWDLETSMLLSQPHIIGSEYAYAYLANVEKDPIFVQTTMQLKLLRKVHELRGCGKIQVWTAVEEFLRSQDHHLKAIRELPLFQRQYVDLTILLAYLSPLIPRPGISNNHQVDGDIANACFIFAKYLVETIETLDEEELKMKFILNYVFLAGTLLARDVVQATEGDMKQYAEWMAIQMSDILQERGPLLFVSVLSHILQISPWH